MNKSCPTWLSQPKCVQQTIANAQFFSKKPKLQCPCCIVLCFEGSSSLRFLKTNQMLVV